MKVFTYGTLMSNHPRHETYMASATLLGQGILENYALYDLGRYPGIIKEKDCKVLGEVYEVSEDMLRMLDDYEEEGSLYRREIVRVQVKEELLSAYTYIYQHSIDDMKKLTHEELPWCSSQ